MTKPSEVYERVVERALRLVPEEAVYIRLLADAWRPDLVDLPDSPSMARLAEMAASNPDTDKDAVLTWVDAYPSSAVWMARNDKEAA